MSVVKYTFYHLSNKEPEGLNNKNVQEYLLKWSMKKCLHVNYFAFNQVFVPDDIDQFTLDLLRDENVTNILQTHFCKFAGKDVARVQIKRVPCTITSMTFFDRLLDSNNNIVCNGTDIDGNRTIRQCMESYKNGIYIADNLKMMLFEDDCEEYSLYSENERAEFMFKLFQHLVTGGKWCQNDTIIDPYLNATKCIYKDLLTVEKTKDFQIQVVTKIYQVITFDSNHSELFPKKNKGIVPYSFAYIAVNPKIRTVAIFHHNVGDTIYT